MLDELLDCVEDDEELLEISVDVLVELFDCTEELESSPHAVSDKTIAAVKTAPKIFCPFFIFYPFRLLVFGTNCSFSIIYTSIYIVKRVLRIFVFFIFLKTGEKSIAFFILYRNRVILSRKILVDFTREICYNNS